MSWQDIAKEFDFPHETPWTDVLQRMSEEIAKLRNTVVELELMVEGRNHEIIGLKKLTTQDPEHGNEYAIVCHYKEQNRIMRDALESIAAEKCNPSFDSALPKLQRGQLISVIDTDMRIAREALKVFNGE